MGRLLCPFHSPGCRIYSGGHALCHESPRPHPGQEPLPQAGPRSNYEHTPPSPCHPHDERSHSVRAGPQSHIEAIQEKPRGNKDEEHKQRKPVRGEQGGNEQMNRESGGERGFVVAISLAWFNHPGLVGDHYLCLLYPFPFRKLTLVWSPFQKEPV